MNRLEKLIYNAENSETGEVYYRDIQPMNDGEYYIDPRTERDENNIQVVKPFCFFNGHYWYVCPDCQDIHSTEDLGKIRPGCCLDIDCQRHQYLGGEHFLIQRDPIIIDDSDAEAI